MNEKIWEFVEAMFAGLPKTQAVVDAKLSIIENMQEKFEVLLIEGKNENEAFGTVVAQFGSMEELRRELGVDGIVPLVTEEPAEPYEKANLRAEYKQFSKLYSIFAAISVGLYILSPIVFFVFEKRSETVATAAFLLFVAIPTVIFVLFGVKDGYYKEQLDLKKQRNQRADRDNEEDPFVGAIYIGATVIFLLLGFIGSWWHPGWLVFLLATAVVKMRESTHSNKTE